jgi:hypothetical protein
MRYIDADALWNDRPQLIGAESIGYKAGFYDCMRGFCECIHKQISHLTADVVAVVRCKDCIHAREVKHRGEVIEGIYRCSYIKMSTNLFDIDYCRYGKRREENEG